MSAERLGEGDGFVSCSGARGTASWPMQMERGGAGTAGDRAAATRTTPRTARRRGRRARTERRALSRPEIARGSPSA